MNIIAIGRSEILYEVVLRLLKSNHKIVGIVTDIGNPEYTKQVADFVEISKNFGIPCLVSSNNTEIAEFLSSLNMTLSLAVSTGHRYRINQEVISRFQIGILNFHGGDIPRYRGNACQSWAILNGEKRMGATIHKMLGDDIDVGPIIMKQFFEITNDTYVIDLWKWLQGVAPEMFLDSISILEKNPDFFIEIEQEVEMGHRCYPRQPEDGKINWFDSNEKILTLIRASGEPYFGAYTYYGNQKVRITRAKLSKINFDYSAMPGQILEYGEHTCKVATGDGAIEISEIIVGEKKLIPINYFKGIRTRLKNDYEK